MLHVPSHLLQPLSLDTNISYDLDMNLFPGLEDPQHMYQPALLIATDWNQYVVENDANCVHSKTECEDDLFSVIESCSGILEADATSTGFIDPDTFQSSLDDITTETTLSLNEDLNFLDSVLYSLPSTNMGSITASGDYVDRGYNLATEKDTCILTNVKGQKRPRSDDNVYPDSKKSKILDFTPLRLPPLVSVCPTSHQCDVYRDI